jgi:hypothetical protein
MTVQELKQKFPKTYNEILHEGIIQERKEAQARIKNELETKEAFNFKL